MTRLFPLLYSLIGPSLAGAAIVIVLSAGMVGLDPILGAAAAGFVLVEEKDFLRNPSDPRTTSVLNGPMKGKTDQFVLKFRKPK